METHIWAEIHRLRHVEKLSLSEISRRINADRKTVRKALQEDTISVRTAPAIRPSKLDAHKDYIAERLKEYPRIPSTALYEEISRRGYTGKIRILWDYVAGIRPNKKETFFRIETLPGEYAQVDWANCGTVRIGTTLRKVSCFVMVLSYSRMIYLEFRLSQRLEDFIQCHINAFKFFGGVPLKALYDNLKTVVLSRLGSDIRFNPRFLEFAGVFLFKPVCCNPGRGNEKGKVESGIKYIRSNFLIRQTIAWPDIQAQAVRWRDETANIRLHATTRERPIDRFDKEKLLLMPLPEKDYDASIVQPAGASSQALVRFDGNAYSVPYAKAYKMLTLKATLQDVRVIDGLQQIALHKRSYERGLVIENPKHYEGLLAEKKKAMASKLKDQFLGLGELAQAYLEGLLLSALYLPHHVSAIMEFVRLYGKTEVLQAIDCALKHKAYGAPYLKNIILQQRSARGMKETMPIVIPARPEWINICVEEQSLALYDDLFEETKEPALPDSPANPTENEQQHD